MLPFVSKIKSVNVTNFTCFGDVDLSFADGINVFIGENGTGKSHMLKLLYATLRGLEQDEDALRTGRERNKEEGETYLADRLMGVFRPDTLGRLARRSQGRSKASVEMTLDPSSWDLDENGEWVFSELPALDVSYEVSSLAKKRVRSGSLPAIETSAIYLPTREVISFFPGFIGLFERHTLEFDETYRDLCVALDTARVRRGRRSEFVGRVVAGLEERLGAKVRFQDGRFYVQAPGLGQIEAHLVAEGLRKLATVMYLLLNGSMTDSSVLFWDEPEASLNPRYVSVLVGLLEELAKEGAQIFLASHDYLLTQKLSLMAEAGDEAIDTRFFLFRPDEDGVEVEAADTLLDLDENPIADEFSEHYADEVDAALGEE